jgi:hypothetical protein
VAESAGRQGAGCICPVRANALGMRARSKSDLPHPDITRVPIILDNCSFLLAPRRGSLARRLLGSYRVHQVETDGVKG